MKKFIKLLVITLLFISNQSHSQGLRLVSDVQLSKLPIIKNDALGFADNLPPSYSFEQYVPMVIKQSGSSCVGFATLYYALSTQYNIAFDITSKIQITSNSFDPYFIYSMVKSKDKEDCSDGSYFHEAYDILMKTGAKKMFMNPFLTCNTQWSESEIKTVLPYTMPYSIEDWGIYNVDDSDFLSNAKNAIYYNFPLVFGVEATNSLYSKSPENNIGISSDGLWKPSETENRLDGHAMTVVGYDDNKFGGAFRVVNSWGSDYGDNGYLWIKYSDFMKNVKTTYIMFLKEEIDPEKNPSMDFSNFQRIVRDDYIMEGQLENNKFNGYGIYHSNENNTSYIGNFSNGIMDGYFLMINNDGLFESTIRNGEFFDFDKLGFSSQDNDVSDNRLMAKKYFNLFDNKNLGLFENPLKKSIGVKKVYKIKE